MHQINLFSIHWSDIYTDSLPFLGFDSREKELLDQKLGIHPKIREWLLVACHQGLALLVEGDPSISHFVKAQLALVKQQPKEVVYTQVQVRNGTAAVTYFGEWMLGISAPLIGDLTMNAALRSAYQRACEQGTLGPYLHRMVQAHFQIEKHIRKQTTLYSGNNDTPTFAANLLKSFANEFDTSKVAVIGYGERGKTMVSHLVDMGIGEIRVFSEKGNVSTEISGVVQQMGLSQLTAQINDFPIIINSLNSVNFLWQNKNFRYKKDAFRLIIDLANHGGIPHKYGGLPKILLIKLDHLRNLHEVINFQKKLDYSNAKAILIENIHKYERWRSEYQHLNVVREFKHHLLNHKAPRWRCLCKTDGNAYEKLPAEKLIQVLIRDLLKNSVLRIKSAKTEQERQAYISLIAQMYLN